MFHVGRTKPGRPNADSDDEGTQQPRPPQLRQPPQAQPAALQIQNINVSRAEENSLSSTVASERTTDSRRRPYCGNVEEVLTMECGPRSAKRQRRSDSSYFQGDVSGSVSTANSRSRQTDILGPTLGKTSISEQSTLSTDFSSNPLDGLGGNDTLVAEEPTTDLEVTMPDLLNNVASVSSERAGNILGNAIENGAVAVRSKRLHPSSCTWENDFAVPLPRESSFTVETMSAGGSGKSCCYGSQDEQENIPSFKSALEGSDTSRAFRRSVKGDAEHGTAVKAEKTAVDNASFTTPPPSDKTYVQTRTELARARKAVEEKDRKIASLKNELELSQKRLRNKEEELGTAKKECSERIKVSEDENNLLRAQLELMHMHTSGRYPLVLHPNRLRPKTLEYVFEGCTRCKEHIAGKKDQE